MKNLSVGKKIALGFTILIALAAALGALAVVSMGKASRGAEQLAREFIPESDLASRLETAMNDTQLATRSYGFTAEATYLAQSKKGLADTDKALQAAKAFAEQHPALTKLRKDIETLEPLTKQYADAVAATEQKNVQIVNDRAAMNAEAGEFTKKLEALRAGQAEHLSNEIKNFAEVGKLNERARKIQLLSDIAREVASGRVAVFKAQALRDPSLIDEALKALGAIDGTFQEIKPLLHVPADVEALEEVLKNAHSYRTSVENLKANYVALDQVAKSRAEIGNRLVDVANEVVRTGMDRTVQAADAASSALASSSRIIVTGLIIAVAIGVLLAVLISRGTTRVLVNVSQLLDESSTQVAAAATQVSSASQSLAEGASEQAASLEETSASLEEISSMTQRNAENAENARQLANQTRAAADSGASDMQKMISAMDAIKTSSDNIAKIIKTIDEIAFQTNILALNAAVEAARAGEAGMGFAVVADEVRNLAQRSAQAAHETADRIEDSIRKSEQGVQISGLVAESLTNIVTKARKVDELVGEIATASREQSQGIQQVNTAVTQMDKVTQSNAASAEESASASEELNAQASTLKDAVHELVQLVGGAGVVAPSAATQASAHDRPANASPKRNGHAAKNGRPVSLVLANHRKEAELPMQSVN